MPTQNSLLKNNLEILVVEDSPTQAAQLKHLLETRGYTVAVAGNGRQALAAMRETKPALVISDIVMPEMDGYQLCKSIRLDETLRDIPVVLVTSLSSPQDVIRGLECGADSFIRKPYNERYLLTRLNYLQINRELRKQEHTQMGLEVALDGQKHFITSERQQILDLLIATYDEAIHLNEGLQTSYKSLNALYHIAEGLNQATSERAVCETALAHALELPGVQAGWILLREGESGFRLGATCGLPPALLLPGALEGDCQCRRKLLSGELDYTTNILECERLRNAKGDTRGLRHHATIPLWVGERILGLVNLFGAEEGLFDDEALKTLYGVGNQVGIALERARLREHLEQMVEERTAALTAEIVERKQAEAKVQRQMQRMMGLRAIDLTITAGADLHATLGVVLDQVTGQLGVDAADVLLLNPHMDLLEFTAGRGFRTRAMQQTRLWLEEDVAGKAVLGQQVVHLRNPAIALAFTRDAQSEEFAEYYAVPLIAKGHVAGVLEVFHRTPFAAGDEWLDYFETLARQAAIAVNNANLSAETQRLLQQTQQIIDILPEGVIVLDQEQRLVLANPTAQAYLPALASLANGAVLTRLGDRPLVDFLKPTAQGQPWHTLTLGQPARFYEVAAQPLPSGPQAGGWVLVILDMTADRERQRYQQAQERLATVGQLSAGIAHDFNNIMGVITLYAQMLSNAPGLSDRQRSQLGTIHDQAGHAANLIRQILDFGRRSVMEPAPLDLLPLLKELIKLLERTLPENVRLGLTYDRNDYLVFGDPARLEQVLMNLALNARDAMPVGGRLHFDLSNLAVAASQAPPLPDMATGDWVRLAVEDTGTGVAPEHLPRLFEPFFTTKAPGKGTGLGLSQVHGIVKQHGGHIDVESRVGGGTTFIIYLPALAVAVDPRPDSNDTRLPEGNGELVLVVEDNEPLRAALTSQLQMWNYRTLEAANGKEALDRLATQRQEIALVLSDLVMPGIGGAAFLKALRRQGDGIPVILLTGYPLQGENMTALQALGLHTWLPKPPDLKQLAQALRDALADDQTASPGGSARSFGRS